MLQHYTLQITLYKDNEITRPNKKNKECKEFEEKNKY